MACAVSVKHESHPGAAFKKEAMSLLPSATPQGASRRGLSSTWSDIGVSASIPEPSLSFAPNVSFAAATVAALGAANLAVAATADSAHALHSAIVPRRTRRVRMVTSEEMAARAAEKRIAMQSHVGPHVGPGSGAPLGFLISRMKTQLERLEDTYTDKADSDDESDL